MTLEKKQQVFSIYVARLILRAAEMGYPTTLGEAFRPQPMAEWYVAHGMGILDSLHEKRLAIDLNLFDAKTGQYLSRIIDYQHLGEWWEQQSDPQREIVCCWGGRFVRPDADHFSFQHLGVK